MTKRIDNPAVYPAPGTAGRDLALDALSLGLLLGLLPSDKPDPRGNGC